MNAVDTRVREWLADAVKASQSALDHNGMKPARFQVYDIDEAISALENAKRLLAAGAES